MLEGFRRRTLRTGASEIFVAEAGEGPPLLLLHGYPQTHVMWHKVAPLPASWRPNTIAAAGAAPQCLDHPERLLRAAVLDIVPTRTVFGAIDRTLTSGYEHWFFLSQPAPLPERLIGNEPAFYLTTKLRVWSGGGTTSSRPRPSKPSPTRRRSPPPATITGPPRRSTSRTTRRTRTGASPVRCSSSGARRGSCTGPSTCWRRGGPRRTGRSRAGRCRRVIILVEEAPDAVLAEPTPFFGA